MEFTAQVEDASDHVLVKINGPIDENSQFPDLSNKTGRIVLDLQWVKYINSIGIKMWIQWLGPIANNASVDFMNCPKPIVLQVNMVKNFLPAGGKVISFYIPTYCDACEHEDSILVNTTDDLEGSGEATKLKGNLPACTSCGGDEVELDVIPKKYFRFTTDQ